MLPAISIYIGLTKFPGAILPPDSCMAVQRTKNKKFPKAFKKVSVKHSYLPATAASKDPRGGAERPIA
jgi:hypothetical protein